MSERSRYGIRRARWLDTGKSFNVATIDGEPVACEPSLDALEDYAERHDLVLITKEMFRQLTSSK